MFSIPNGHEEANCTTVEGQMQHETQPYGCQLAIDSPGVSKSKDLRSFGFGCHSYRIEGVSSVQARKAPRSITGRVALASDSSRGPRFWLILSHKSTGCPTETSHLIQPSPQYPVPGHKAT